MTVTSLFLMRNRVVYPVAAFATPGAQIEARTSHSSTASIATPRISPGLKKTTSKTRDAAVEDRAGRRDTQLRGRRTDDERLPPTRRDQQADGGETRESEADDD